MPAALSRFSRRANRLHKIVQTNRFAIARIFLFRQPVQRAQSLR
jgi:hypothetical protein